jgi:hypothetical protein
MLKSWLHAYEYWVKSNFNLCWKCKAMWQCCPSRFISPRCHVRLCGWCPPHRIVKLACPWPVTHKAWDGRISSCVPMGTHGKPGPSWAHADFPWWIQPTLADQLRVWTLWLWPTYIGVATWPCGCKEVPGDIVLSQLGLSLPRKVLRVAPKTWQNVGIAAEIGSFSSWLSFWWLLSFLRGFPVFFGMVMVMMIIIVVITIITYYYYCC